MPTYSGIFKDDTDTPVGGRIVRAYRRDTGALLGEVSSSDGLPIPGDPSFANVAVLLHMEGEATTTDSSPSPKTVTINPGAALSSSGAKFGDKGLQPSSAGLAVASHSDFALPGDFTFECWFYVISWSPGFASLFNIGNYSSGALFRVQSGLIELYINEASNNVSTSITTGAWHHVAWARESGTVRVFLDGALVGSYTNSGSIPAGDLLVGVSQHNGGEYLNGYIDELRLTKGIARYTAAFTPPSAPFPNTSSSTTNALGSYSVDTGHTGEVVLHFLDDAAGTTYNDKIMRVLPP